MAKGPFDSLNVRFSGLINNLTSLVSEHQNSYGTGPFGNLVYVVPPSLDPDFRLEWLNEWQEDYDNSVKARVRGKFYVLVNDMKSSDLVNMLCFRQQCKSY